VRIDSREILQCRCGIMNVIRIDLKRSSSVNETTNIDSVVPAAIDFNDEDVVLIYPKK
jgi:hypothetical protein